MKYNIKGNLTNTEWEELVGLDYILTWNYTNNYDKDLERYKELSSKR